MTPSPQASLSAHGLMPGTLSISISGYGNEFRDTSRRYAISKRTEAVRILCNAVSDESMANCVRCRLGP